MGRRPAATHGDGNVRLLGELSGEQLWCLVGELDVEFVHDVDYFRVDALGGWAF